MASTTAAIPARGPLRAAAHDGLSIWRNSPGRRSGVLCPEDDPNLLVETPGVQPQIFFQLVPEPDTHNWQFGALGQTPLSRVRGANIRRYGRAGYAVSIAQRDHVAGRFARRPRLSVWRPSQWSSRPS
jgi:hypothetical protein